MKKITYNALIIIFLLLLLTDVVSAAFGLNSLHTWVKPLLMPVLAVYLLVCLKENDSKVWLLALAGLFFAWAGDVFLLFENRNPSFFLFGLASFLCTHICYIILFSKLIKPDPKWWFNHIWVSVGMAGYGGILMYILWNHLGGMKIPVIVYAACISIMVILSHRLQPCLHKATWIYFVIGASLFFISDSILALNKFLQPISFAGPAIMLTYGLAQYLITKGTVKQFSPEIGREDQAPAE